ncbi:hypothetical protein [Paraburkholderia ginsengiterrae]|uniref:hypothetical protein n=1 Tax=Paraburkholderia ginsengiterrae TaxID=1462993 RepID=UPI000AE2C21D|nr:hypothetical protein [Paraburkholderia ginsengiterrae]
MKLSVRNSILSIVSAILLAACGGGGESKNSDPGKTVTSAFGNAVVTKTLQPGVTDLSGNPNVTQNSSNAFTAAANIGNYDVGSVFIYNDRAYVITQIVGSQPPYTIGTRDAYFDEVISDIQVTGDFTLSDLDPSRAVIETSPDIGLTLDSAAAKSNVAISLPGDTKIDCKIDNAASNADFNCSGSQSSNSVGISGTLGIKNFHVKVNIHKSAGQHLITILSAEPYFRGSIGILGGKLIADQDFELFRPQFPVPYTLGFMVLNIPFSLFVSAPLVDATLNYEINLSDSNDNVTTSSTLTSAQGEVTSTSAEATATVFFGFKLGLAVALERTPTSFIPHALWPADESANIFASAGTMVKYGLAGTLGVKSLATSPPSTCFKYSLGPAAGADLVLNFPTGTDSIKQIPLGTLTTFGTPYTSAPSC